MAQIEVRPVTETNEQAQFQDVLHYSFQEDWARSLFPLSEGTIAWGGFQEGRLTAGVIESPHEMYLFGERVRMLGIGGVASLPEYRNAGAVRRIHEAILQTAGSRGYELSALYPFSFGFYAKFGYGSLGPCYRNRFAPDDLRWTKPAEGHRISTVDPDALAEQAHSTWYPSFQAQRDFASAGAAATLSAALREATDGGKHVRACLDADDQPSGFIIYSISPPVNHERTFTIDELAWRDGAAYRSLLAFVWSHRGQCARVEWSWTAGELVPLSLREPRYDRSPEYSWMARPINVAGILERKARFERFSDELSFSLIDPAVPANTGRYTVTGTSVRHEPVPGENDTIAFPHFSSMLFGRLAPQEAALLTDLPFDADTAEQLFAPRPVLMTDDF